MNDYYAIISLVAKADKVDVYRMTRQACLDLYNLLWLRCYLSLDGGKILCWYRAPDAETVRSILRQQRLTNVDVKPAVIQPVLETSASAAVVASVLTVIELGEAKESLDPAVDCLQSAGLQLVRRFTSQTGNQVIVIANREK